MFSELEVRQLLSYLASCTVRVEQVTNAGHGEILLSEFSRYSHGLHCFSQMNETSGSGITASLESDRGKSTAFALENQEYWN